MPDSSIPNDVPAAPFAPYLGPHSFSIGERGLFHGRARDLTELMPIATIYPLSVLHAPSGAGKSSVLMAALIPALERDGRVVVVCRPGAGANPVAVVREAVATQLIPAPTVELQAIERFGSAMKALGHEGADEWEHCSLAAAKRWYCQLEAYEPQRRDLVLPFGLGGQAAERSRGESGVARPTAAFARFLYLDAGEKRLAAHLGLLETMSCEPGGLAGSAGNPTELMESLTLADYRGLISAPWLAEWHADWVKALCAEGVSLAGALVQVARLLRHACTGITVVLDQFEELFTRFTGRAALPAELFEQMQGVLKARSELPIQFLVALRDDYVAQLDLLERQTGSIPAAARYHLGLLRSVDAEEVIRAPFRDFNLDYEEQALVELKGDLTEDGEIEPGHVQIVCRELWDKWGKEQHKALLAAGAARKLEAGDRPRLRKDPDLDGLGGVRGILEGHFRRVLEELILEPETGSLVEFNVLDLLEPLSTSRGTRNYARKDELLERRPLLRRDRRVDLLDRLRLANVVRVETYASGDYVEISHENLLRPIAEETAKRRPGWILFRGALDRVERLLDQPFRSIPSGFTPGELRAIDTFLDELEPAALARGVAEIVFRALVLELPETAQRGEMVARWFDRLPDGAASGGQPDPDLAEVLAALPRSGLLAGQAGDEIRYFDRAWLEAAICRRWLDLLGLAEPHEQAKILALVARNRAAPGRDRYLDHLELGAVVTALGKEEVRKSLQLTEREVGFLLWSAALYRTNLIPDLLKAFEEHLCA